MPSPIDKGGTSKSRNVAVLDLTYEENISSVHQGSETHDIHMNDSEPVKANQPSRSTEMDSHKKETVRFFNLDKDKFYIYKSVYVYMEKTNSQLMGRLHPMHVGHILHKKLNVQNITSIEKVGLNRVKVGLKTPLDANKLISNPLLNAENLKAYIPNNLLLTKGLLRFVDTSFDDEYLKNNIESNFKILDINRLKRRVTSPEGKSCFVPRQLVVLTFEGNILPKEVIINSVICPVEPYVQRVIQCFIKSVPQFKGTMHKLL